MKKKFSFGTLCSGSSVMPANYDRPMALNYPVIWKGFRLEILFFLKLFITRLERRRDRYHIGGKGGDFLGFYSYGTYYFLFIDASA